MNSSSHIGTSINIKDSTIYGFTYIFKDQRFKDSLNPWNFESLNPRILKSSNFESLNPWILWILESLILESFNPWILQSGFKIQEYKDSRIQGFKDLKIQGFKDSKTQDKKYDKLTAYRIQCRMSGGFKNSRILRFKESNSKYQSQSFKESRIQDSRITPQ